jgi:hypothetical protein
MPFREGTDQVGDPLSGQVEEFEAELGWRVDELRRLADAAGRPRPSVTLFNACPHADALDRYRNMGVDRVVFWLPTAAKDTTLETLHHLRALLG